MAQYPEPRIEMHPRIGCQACVQACTECDTRRGESMIHLEFIDRAQSTQTVPVVCMHCEQPTCAEVCPADAIKRTGDGVVQSALKPRCIACGNSCAVLPQPEQGRIFCPCHEGIFEIATGRPLAGPARRPLTRILLERRGRDIFAAGIELRTI